MSNSPYRPVLEVVVISAIAFTIHWIVLSFWVPDTSRFEYSLGFLYGFFTVCSLLIVFALVKMSFQNIDSVGYTFMLLTVVKMVLAYVLLYPVLNATHAGVKAEKANFFVIFALFLVIETTVAIRMLNQAK